MAHFLAFVIPFDPLPPGFSLPYLKKYLPLWFHFFLIATHNTPACTKHRKHKGFLRAGTMPYLSLCLFSGKEHNTLLKLKECWQRNEWLWMCYCGESPKLRSRRSQFCLLSGVPLAPITYSLWTLFSLGENERIGCSIELLLSFICCF